MEESGQSPSVTLEELTEAVLTLCFGTDELRGGLLQDVDRHVALAELFILRVSVAAYANQTFFKTDVQQKVREVFNRCLHAVLMDSGNRMIEGQPNKAIDEMNRRSDLYLDAIETPHDLGPGWNVGKVFAKLCGHEKDPRVIGVGSIEFAGALTAVTRFLRGSKAMEGGEIIDLPEEELNPDVGSRR